MAQETHFVLKLEQLGVGFLNVTLLLLLLVIVLVIIVVFREQIVPLLDLHLLQHSVKVCNAHRLLQCILDYLNLGGLICKLLPNGHQLSLQIPDLIFLHRAFIQSLPSTSIIID